MSKGQLRDEHACQNLRNTYFAVTTATKKLLQYMHEYIGLTCLYILIARNSVWWIQ